MSPSHLRPVAIPELRALQDGKHWRVDQPIAGFDSLTPVRGTLQVVHLTSALEVTTTVETILTLCCARCLRQYNQTLRAEVRELIEFHGAPCEGLNAPPAEVLDDRLDPQGRFDPERWLFEQLSLRLPLVNRCGNDCPGPDRWGGSPSTVDPRWAVLQDLSAAEHQPSTPSPN